MIQQFFSIFGMGAIVIWTIFGIVAILITKKYRYIFFYSIGSDHGHAVIDLKWKERPCTAGTIDAIETKISKAENKNICITGWRRLWK